MSDTDDKLQDEIIKELEKQPKKYVYSPETIKAYNDKFKAKHASEMIKCDVCLQDYSYKTKYYHSKSKRHEIALKLLAELVTS